MQLNQEQFERAKFIGVYGKLGEPQLREPVREFEGAHYDLFGRPIDISDMFLIAEKIRQISCGCCTNGCTCHNHMDIPRGIRPLRKFLPMAVYPCSWILFC